MNAADTSWILTSTALVLLMTLPGLALFYAGLVQARNILSVLMQCMGIACAASLLWFAFGYSLAFDAGNAWLGGTSRFFLAGIDRFVGSGFGDRFGAEKQFLHIIYKSHGFFDFRVLIYDYFGGMRDFFDELG